MKIANKVLGIASAVVISAAALAGCAKKGVDENGNPVPVKIQNSAANKAPKEEKPRVVTNSKYLVDFDQAVELARKDNKRIFLVMSQDEWDMKSVGLKENCIFKGKFINAMKDNYVLVNLNWRESEFQAMHVNENSSAKEKKNAEKLRPLVEQKMLLSNVYTFTSTPAMFILDKNGSYMANIPVDAGIGTPESLIQLLKESEDQFNTMENLFYNVEVAEGNEKLAAIDDVFSRVPEDFHSTLVDYARKYVELDAENATGKAGSYEFKVVKYDALKLMVQNKRDEAIDMMLSLADSGKLSAAEKTMAYFYCASFANRGNPPDYDKVASYLELASQTAENPEEKETFAGYREGVLKQKEAYEKYMADMMNAAAEDVSESGETSAPSAE